jgi:hypothetical protein
MSCDLTLPCGVCAHDHALLHQLAEVTVSLQDSLTGAYLARLADRNPVVDDCDTHSIPAGRDAACRHCCGVDLQVPSNRPSYS